MKAWVLKRIGDISLQEAEVPAPAADEVRIRVEAAGICGSDIPRIYETGAHRMPLIPGHEFSGVVEGIGKDVSSYWLGKRVAVFPKIACGKCGQCLNGLPDMCSDYDYVGSRRDGAFAKYVTAPMGNLLELPDGVGFDVAAMMEPMAVAANAVRTGCGRKGGLLAADKPVAVCGLGPIGLMAVMFLKEAGYGRVCVIGKRDAQKEKVKALGVPEEDYCNSAKEDAAEWLKEVTDGGAFAYFECVGSNESIRYGIEGSAPGGRLILVGNPRSDMSLSRDAYWKILRNRLTVRGIWNSAFRQTDSMYREDDPDDWNYVLRKLTDGKIDSEKLISHRFPLDKLDQGFSIMRDKTEDYTKVLMVKDGG